MIYNMLGIPEDGSTPFLMAIIEMGPASAERIWAETAHLYTQKLSGYRLEPRLTRAGRLILESGTPPCP